MTDTKPAQDAADVTEVPSGLDVVVTVPGTIVGAHDLQGADGTVRTDRPGEILGTPAQGDDSAGIKGRKHETEKHDYVRNEVDRANREELPLLGGAIDDGWEPAAKSTRAAKGLTTDAVAAPARGVTTAQMPAPAAPADSGIKVSKSIDKG